MCLLRLSRVHSTFGMRHTTAAGPEPLTPAEERTELPISRSFGDSRSAPNRALRLSAQISDPDAESTR